MSYGLPATSKAFNRELMALCQACPDDHMILELGSGHTSKIIYQNRGNSPYIALEQSKPWHKDILTKAPHLAPHVLHSPLIPVLQGFTLWFDLSVCQDKLKNIGLIVMDGPTGSKRVPGPLLLYPYLAENYTIIADDIHRPAYVGFLQGWADHKKIQFSVFPNKSSPDYGVLRA